METLVVFRHGKSELNLYSELTGEEAEYFFETGLPPNADLTGGLIEEGIKDAYLLQRVLASIAIDVCFSSPALRAVQTATIGLDERIAPDEFMVRDGLIERHRGLFHFLPDVIGTRLKKEYPDCWQEPLSTLRRRPKDGETLLEVIDRLAPVVEEADAFTEHGTVAFSTHAEATIALRALVGRLDDDRLAAPLVPYQTDLLPLQRANWIGHCQTDIYTKRNPYNNSLASHMTHFQSIGVKPRSFTTGWIELPPL